MVGVNWQADKGFPRPPATLPVLAIVSDWMRDLSAFAGLDVRLWRFMGGLEQAIALAPNSADVCWWNEPASGDRTPLLDEVLAMRQARPGVRIHYGAEHVGGTPSPALVAACDVLDVHCPIWIPAPAGCWVTELELTPTAPEWGEVVDWCRAASVPVFVWGADLERADINDHQDILAALAALNHQGGTHMADPAIEQVLAQNALIAAALYDIANILNAGTVTGVDPALLQDAKTRINAIDPHRFNFK